MSSPLVQLQNLRVTFGRGSVPVVRGVDMRIDRGECFALVGQSGSGKTVTALSLLGLVPETAQVEVDSCVVAGVETRGFRDTQWRDLRGTKVGLVSQDALSSLDPLRRVGDEIVEVLQAKPPRLTLDETQSLGKEAMQRAALPDPELRWTQYPHELSGGLRQRALIASAIAGSPDLLVADEPTTALDSITRARILSLLDDLKHSGIGLLLVTHDIALVSQIADRIGVMREGDIVETGRAVDILQSPQHSYTKELLGARPRLNVAASDNRAPASAGPPTLSCRRVSRVYSAQAGAAHAAVNDVSFDLAAGTSLGVVGESGSGKSTLARILMGFEPADGGEVHLFGQPWSALSERDKHSRRGTIQLIDQDPFDALDPRWSVARTLGEAIRLEDTAATRSQRRARLHKLLDQVGLSEGINNRRPHQLSGGQRQRVVIARALARRPQVLICDEPVSALDAVVHSRILELLASLQDSHGLSIVLISHDLAAVARYCDEVMVMHDGRCVDHGPTAAVLASAQHRVTRELLEAATSIVP